MATEIRFAKLARYEAGEQLFAARTTPEALTVAAMRLIGPSATTGSE